MHLLLSAAVRHAEVCGAGRLAVTQIMAIVQSGIWLSYNYGIARKARKGKIMEYKFTTDNFEAEVLQADVPVLVDFYADWCNPCKMMGPVVAKLAEEYEGRLKVGKCNVDENMQTAQQYHVSSIPAFVIFKDGKPESTFVGAMSASELKAKADAVLG